VAVEAGRRPEVGVVAFKEEVPTVGAKNAHPAPQKMPKTAMSAHWKKKRHKAAVTYGWN
jgi:hypothetical protein